MKDSQGALKINEIFYSIQGEASSSGFPTVFVRLSGCHLRCTYCDTKYAYHEGTYISTASVLEKIASWPCRRVCISGGEPLLQKEVHTLVKALCDNEYSVSMETSGDIDCVSLDSRVSIVMDVKTPDSGEQNRFCSNNLLFAKPQNSFKFVICSVKDFDWAVNFCLREDLFTKTQVFLSPSFQVVSERWLAEKILGSGLPFRLQLQLHKYIWTPNTRGV